MRMNARLALYVLAAISAAKVCHARDVVAAPAQPILQNPVVPAKVPQQGVQTPISNTLPPGMQKPLAPGTAPSPQTQPASAAAPGAQQTAQQQKAPTVKIPIILPGEPSTYESISSSQRLKQQKANPAAAAKPLDAAIAFARSQLGAQNGGYVATHAYQTKSMGVTHVYIDQLVGGIKVQNGAIIINVGRDGRVISYNDRFYKGRDASKMILWTGASSSRFVKPNVAFGSLIKYMKMQVDVSKLVMATNTDADSKSTYYVLKGVPNVLEDVRVQQSYVHTKAGVLEATWEFFVNLGARYYHAHVSADGTRLVAFYNWGSDLWNYNVVKFGETDVAAAGRTVVNYENNPTVWPIGWHAKISGPTDTTGNNVYAYTKSQGMFSSKVTNTAAQSANGVYNFPHDPKGNPSNYKEAAITNLFYMNNMLHGFLLNYEFTEAAGNFQSINFSKLGKGRDPVMAIAQASDEPDGASFSTPPDGQSPVMSMGIFGFLWGKRDSSFDNTVITHEYAHGLTSRLTGGKDNADCLQSMEAMGLAEGWSDFLAIMSTAKKTHTRATPREIGVYAETKSMRDKPYTTDMSVNPLKYKDILVDTEEHAVGTIWASMLWDMYWNLVDTLGFTEAYTKPDLTKGNTLALQIVINALKLQPCNPTFAQARSAIIEAEENMTGGKYSCQIWAAFAKRGLGPMALLIEGQLVEDYSMPINCAAASGVTSARAATPNAPAATPNARTAAPNAQVAAPGVQAPASTVQQAKP